MPTALVGNQAAHGQGVVTFDLDAGERVELPDDAGEVQICGGVALGERINVYPIEMAAPGMRWMRSSMPASVVMETPIEVSS